MNSPCMRFVLHWTPCRLGENPPWFMEKQKVWNEAVIKYSWSCYLCFGCERLCQICESGRVFHSACSPLLSSPQFRSPQLLSVQYNLRKFLGPFKHKPKVGMRSILRPVLYSHCKHKNLAKHFLGESGLSKVNCKNFPLRL